MKRVAIYIHHATDGDWRAWQPKMLQDHVYKQGNTVVGSYIECGYIGRDRYRPELERLIEKCGCGGIDEVAIVRMSHLSRNISEFIKIYERLKKCGVGLSIMEFGTSNKVSEYMTLLKAVGYGT